MDRLPAQCPRCGSPAPSAGQACRQCAAAGGVSVLAPGSDPAPLLARANLLRMRGQWTEAADLCVDILRLQPANATAHSLLGDLYQDQGRAEEARYWYQVALELNPQSDADRAKLRRAEEMLEARQQRAEWEDVIQGRKQPLATKLLVRESLQRVAAVAGAAVCGMILVLAVLGSIEHPASGPDDDPFPFAPSAPRIAASATDTPLETALLKLLKQSSGGTSVPIRVSVNPRALSATIRFFVPFGVRARHEPAEFRVLVMREGYRMARAVKEASDAAHELPELLKNVDVEAVGPRPGGVPGVAGAPELIFSATLPRTEMAAEAERLRPEELVQFFSEKSTPLWAPELAQ